MRHCIAAVFSDPDPVEPYIYALLDPGDGFIIMNYESGYLLILSKTQGKLSKKYQYLNFYILIYTIIKKSEDLLLLDNIFFQLPQSILVGSGPGRIRD